MLITSLIRKTLTTSVFKNAYAVGVFGIGTFQEIVARNFSTLNKTLVTHPTLKMLLQRQVQVNPVGPLYLQSRGLKVKNVLKLRCRDCQYVWRRGQMFVICKTKPRHNQKSLMDLKKLRPNPRDRKYLEGPQLKQFQKFKRMPF